MLMRTKLSLVASSALLFSACAQGEAPREAADEGQTLTRPVSALAGGGSLRPGLYHVVQTGDVEIEEERCIEADNVAAGRFLADEDMGHGWAVERNSLANGKIEVIARHPTGSRAHLQGSFGKDSYVVNARMEMKVNGETHLIRTVQNGRFAAPTCAESYD